MMTLLQKAGYVPTQIRLRNRRENEKLLAQSSSPFVPGQFIENQQQWGSIRFGAGRKSNMQYAGCGILAAANALLALGEPVDSHRMAELICSFEKDGAVLRGDFGVSPQSIQRYLEAQGYRTQLLTCRDKEAVDRLGELCRAAIVTVYNDGTDLLAQLHTVCMAKNRAGRFVVHNAGWQTRTDPAFQKANAAGFASLDQAVCAVSKRAVLLSCIGIR